MTSLRIGARTYSLAERSDHAELVFPPTRLVLTSKKFLLDHVPHTKTLVDNTASGVLGEPGAGNWRSPTVEVIVDHV